MDLYRYFKGHQRKGVWTPYLIGSEEEKKAFQDEKYGFCTVLGVNGASGVGEALSGRLVYSGPFYLDIDNDDLKKSIKITKAAVKAVIKHGIQPQTMSVWLSGKRGFHITVPMGVFTHEDALEDLPIIYKELVGAMGVKDIDWSVYSRGKGRMWRLPDRKRLDVGTYKVGIELSELDKMTPESYLKLCAQPAEVQPPKINGTKFPVLESLFRFAHSKAKMIKPVATTLIDDNLRNALGEDLYPPCAQNLMANTNIRPGKGFNDKSVQMMKAVRAFIPADEQREQLELFAVNSSGESHDLDSRRDHVKRSFGSIAGSGEYGWSCKSILSILSRPPCDTCKICFIKYQQEDSIDEEIERREQKTQPTGDVGKTADFDGQNDSAAFDRGQSDEALETAVADLASQSSDISSGDDGGGGNTDDPPNRTAPDPSPQKPTKATKDKERAPEVVDDASQSLMIHQGGYYFMSAANGGMRQVTNFVLKITKLFMEYVANIDDDRRVGVQASVFVDGKYVSTVQIPEDGWKSRGGFITAFDGITNLAFLGKDEDVQKMKTSLLNGIEKTAIKIQRVYAYGIHHKMVGESHLFTYVEPGYSVDNYGNENLYSLSGRVSGAPRLYSAHPMIEGQADPKMSEVLGNLLSINVKAAVAQLLGWNMACILKRHIFTKRNEFPLVSLWGNAEAGKTQTSGCFAALHGIHYLSGSGLDNAAPLSLGGGGATPFAASSFISESMTVPRLVEEFNQFALGKKYDEFTEHFKKAYNDHPIKRGTIRNSKMHGTGQVDAHVQDIYLTGPLLLISEQSIMTPALVHRCVQVQMNQADRKGHGMEEAFFAFKKDYVYLDRFAKTAYMEAIHLSPDVVMQWIDDAYTKIPTKVGDRAHYNYCVVYAGLQYFKYLDAKYALGLSARVEELEAVFLSAIGENASEIAARKTQSEADRVMQSFAIMALMSVGDNAMPWLERGKGYQVEGNFLYIDGVFAHSNYLRFTVSQHDTPIIRTIVQFKELIRHTEYCVSISATLDNFARGRPVMKFDLAKMAAKGIETTCFIP